MMVLTVTVLGCGSSGGVPRIGGNWGACDPDNPKNRRRRCSILLERSNPDTGARTAVLVDTSPDVRNQLLDTGTATLDGVLYTHEHADHIHGIDDLRVVAYNGARRIDIHAGKRTLRQIRERFGYCFETPPGSNYPPIVTGHLIEAGQVVEISGEGGSICALPFLQDHGDIDAFGFRIGALAYSSDIKGLPPESVALLKNLDVWIIDALRYTQHPTHLSVDEALEWIDRIKPKRAILTNMHVDLDYDTLTATLPHGVEPAYDGLQIALPDIPAEKVET